MLCFVKIFLFMILLVVFFSEGRVFALFCTHNLVSFSKKDEFLIPISEHFQKGFHYAQHQHYRSKGERARVLSEDQEKTFPVAKREKKVFLNRLGRCWGSSFQHFRTTANGKSTLQSEFLLSFNSKSLLQNVNGNDTEIKFEFPFKTDDRAGAGKWKTPTILSVNIVEEKCYIELCFSGMKKKKSEQLSSCVKVTRPWKKSVLQIYTVQQQQAEKEEVNEKLCDDS